MAWARDNQSMDERDRRKCARFEYDLSLALYDRDEELLDEDPQLRNVSLRGFSFMTIQQMEEGENFRFQLGLTGHSILSGTARVRWSIPSNAGVLYHCGAEIRSLGWGDKRKLRKFLNPAAPNLTELLDALLILGCLGVVYFFIQDTGLLRTQNFGQTMDSFISWFPFSIVTLSCLLGIGLHFKR